MPLPPGWSEHWSKTSGRIFFRHRDSGVVQWERPSDTSIKPYGGSRQPGVDDDECQLPDGWKMHRSKATGKAYYRNARTGRTMNIRPSEEDAEPAPARDIVHDGNDIRRGRDPGEGSHATPLPLEAQEDRAPRWLARETGQQQRYSERSVSSEPSRGEGARATDDGRRQEHARREKNGANDFSRRGGGDVNKRMQQNLGSMSAAVIDNSYAFVQCTRSKTPKRTTSRDADRQDMLAPTASDDSAGEACPRKPGWKPVSDTPRLLEGAAAEKRTQSINRLLKSRDGSRCVQEACRAVDADADGSHDSNWRTPPQQQRRAASGVRPGMRRSSPTMLMGLDARTPVDLASRGAVVPYKPPRPMGPAEALGSVLEAVDISFTKMSQDTTKTLGVLGLLPEFVLNPNAGTAKRLNCRPAWQGGRKLTA